jgi:acyl-coenzyme A synthetase/AMP-(fatty) acid ligase
MRADSRSGRARLKRFSSRIRRCERLQLSPFPTHIRVSGPMAYIALKEGQTATEEALITHCKEHLATFKVPCLIKFRDELPKLSTGKVPRRVLRDETR